MSEHRPRSRGQAAVPVVELLRRRLAEDEIYTAALEAAIFRHPSSRKANQ